MNLIKEVNNYIKYCFRKSKEDNEEDYDENYIIIDYMWTFNKDMEQVLFTEFNKLLIEEMTRRGYKHTLGDESIEFYRK